MKTAFNTLRILFFLALGAVATLLLFGEENDPDTGSFLLRVLIDKGASIAIFYYLYRRTKALDEARH